MSLDGFKAVYRIRDFKLLFWGQAVSALGDWVGTLAFIVAAGQLAPDRPAAVAIVLVLRLIPSFFATPLGGVLSDRWDRRKIMIASDLVRLAIIAAVPFVPRLGALYAFAFFSEAFSLVFLPARDASVPNLVPKDRLEAANAMLMGSSYGGIPLSGPVFALMAWLGAHYPLQFIGQEIFRARPYSFAFIFDALTYLVSALFILRIRTPLRTSRVPAAEEESLFQAIEEGARYIQRRPLHRNLAFAVTVAMLGGGVLFALGDRYVHDTLGGNDVAFGWLMGLFGVGMVMGFFVSQLKPAGRGALWMVRISLLTMGGVLISMGIVAWLAVGYMVAVVFGIAFSVSLIIAMSAVQAQTEDPYRGRVMAAVHMMVRAALSFGALGAGGIATVVPDRGLQLARWNLDKNQVALVIAGLLIAFGTVGVRGAAEATET